MPEEEEEEEEEKNDHKPLTASYFYPLRSDITITTTNVNYLSLKIDLC